MEEGGEIGGITQAQKKPVALRKTATGPNKL